jgi:hypothetical protein
MQFSCLKLQCVMLTRRLTYLLGGLVVGLPLLLPASGSAVACGRAQDDHRHVLVAKAGAHQSVGPVASLAQRNVPPSKRSTAKSVSSSAALHHVTVPPSTPAAEPLRPDVAAAKKPVRESAPRAAHHFPAHEGLLHVSRVKMELASSSPSSKLCQHAGGCGCCGSNGGCCGMACCVAALPASVLSWPDSHGYAWADPTSRLLQARNSGPLFRPPCASA